MSINSKMSQARKLLPQENTINTVQEAVSPSAGGEDDEQPFHSFLATEMEDRIRAIRDIYKKDVQRTHNESEVQLLQKRHNMQQEADKMTVLLNLNKTALQQLEEQRKATTDTLQQTKSHVESLRKQMGAQENNAQALSLTKTAMQQLLADKRNN